MPFQYAAKVICGVNRGRGHLAQGTYETLINIHSPNRDVIPFRYKLAQASKAEDGPISPFRDGRIRGDGAQFFGCAEMHNLFDIPAATLIDGFFVIECRLPLDVVAVYTTNDINGAGVPCIEIERVFERQTG
jgi:hypothetical protein